MSPHEIAGTLNTPLLILKNIPVLFVPSRMIKSVKFFSSKVLAACNPAAPAPKINTDVSYESGLSYPSEETNGIHRRTPKAAMRATYFRFGMLVCMLESISKLKAEKRQVGVQMKMCNKSCYTTNFFFLSWKQTEQLRCVSKSQHKFAPKAVVFK